MPPHEADGVLFSLKNEETQAQKGSITYLNSQSYNVGKTEFEHKKYDSGNCTLNPSSRMRK
jgi:hypothetical protein